jgi:hypothetical protein
MVSVSRGVEEASGFLVLVAAGAESVTKSSKRAEHTAVYLSHCTLNAELPEWGLTRNGVKD